VDGKDVSSYYVAWTSFYPAHHISTGEGGMVCTDIPELKKLFMSFLGGVEIVTVDLESSSVELVETDLIMVRSLQWYNCMYLLISYNLKPLIYKDLLDLFN
jgi:hypothetical protein